MMLDRSGDQCVQPSHFTEGETEAWVWDGNKSEVGPEVNGKARPEYMSKARPFHDAPVHLTQESGHVGVPTAYPYHHLSPRDLLWAGGQAGAFPLLPWAGPGTTECLLLKGHLVKRNRGDHCPIEPSVSKRPGSLPLGN